MEKVLQLNSQVSINAFSYGVYRMIAINWIHCAFSLFISGKKWDSVTFVNKNVGDVIHYIDENFGLAMPVFIFGYTKMRRGISFRSNKRVPTHEVSLN